MNPSALLARAVAGDKNAERELGRVLDNLSSQVGNRRTPLQDLNPQSSPTFQFPWAYGLRLGTPGVLVGAGTAFPTDPAPVADDLFYRTDLNLIYYYTGSTWAVATFNSASLTAGRVVIVGTAGVLEDDAGLTYNATTNALTVAGSVTVSSFAAGSVVVVTTDGLLAVDDGLTYNAAANILFADNISVLGALTAATLTASALTAGRVPIVSTAGLLADDSTLLFNAGTDTLTATNLVVVTGLTNSALTAGRVVYVGTAGLLTDEAAFAYNASTNTLTVGELIDSGLTASLLVQSNGSKQLASVADTPALLTLYKDLAWGRIIAGRLALSGLRGLWHMADTGEATVQDYAPAGRDLTIASNPTYGVYQATGMPEVPYMDFDGTGDILSFIDAAWHSITGAVTLIGWYRPDDGTPASATKLGGHFNASGNQRSYILHNATDGTLQAIISSNGTATFTVSSVATMADGTTWYLCALRYTPSTELAVFLQGVKAVNTTSIPAAIHDSTAPFTLGGNGASGELISGHLALWSLHAGALTDTTLAAVWANERGLFGV